MGRDIFVITALISIVIVILVLQTTYLYTRLHGTRTAGAFLSLQVSFLLWAVLRLSEAYAPTKSILRGNLLIQYGLIALIVLLLSYLFLIPDKKIRISYPLCITAIALLVLLTITAFMDNKSILYYSVPVLSSELLCLMLTYGERKATSVTGNLSLKTVIQSIGDCILVLDTKRRIMDVNYSFFEETISLGKPGSYEDFCRCLMKAGVLEEKDYQHLEGLPLSIGEREMDFLINRERLTCICKSTPLMNSKDNRIGTMISFHDISGFRKLTRELEDKKKELTELQDKLKDYLTVVDRLETAKEKREIFLKIQNSIGQEIMELLTMLEVVQLKADQVSPTEIELAIESCRSMIGRIRSSVNEIEGNGLK